MIHLSSLNPAQREAVTTTEGPVLIIAGPGSGKTRTLVERIVHLIQQGEEAESIMVATFTEKAAKELITRVSNRMLELNMKVNLNEMYIGTLHSIFLRFLEEHREFTRLKRSYRLLDQFDQKYFVFRNLEEYTSVEGADDLLGRSSRWDKSEKIIGYIGKIAEECIDPEVLCAADEESIRAIGEFFKIYSSQLSDENALDFSTIQSEALYLLENNPQILQKLQEKIRYIMVDEYQDTNTIQERILLLLASSHQNICVVGDDDQGLYRFRGATIRNILEFQNNFPQGLCKQITLSINYRSHPGIVDFYNRWMDELDWEHDGTTFRFEKTIQPKEADFGDYASVVKVSCEDTEDNYFEEVYQFIKHLEDEGTLEDYNQIAFLFKSVKNHRVIALAQYLEERDINVFSPRSGLFFEREEIQLLLGAIIFIFPNIIPEHLQWDETVELDVWQEYESWKRRFTDELRRNPDKHASLLKWCQRRAKQHLLLQESTNYAFTALIYQLLEFPMFSEYMEVDLNDNKVNLRAAYNIATLTKLLNKFEYLYGITVFTPKILTSTLRNFFNNYLRFIIDGGIEEYENFDEYAPSGCVSFMTIHQSKGLEFPIVFVGSLNAVPRKQYTEVDELLQSRYYSKPIYEPLEQTKNYDFWRLYYTAFSRPQNLLVLTAPEKQGRGRCPSKYFEPIYNPVPAWDNGELDLSELELEKVKPINIKHEYSFTSHILLYENCPLQYKFYKELEFASVRSGATMFGQLLHQTIEDIHKAVLRGEPHTLTNDNIEHWFNTNYTLLSKNLKAYLHDVQLNALLRQILRYRDRNENQWHRIKEAEVDVSLVKEDYILKGTIDLIQGEDGTVELIDFKSGDKPDVNSTDTKVRGLLQQYRRQLEVYAHLVEERTGNKVSKMHLYYPKEEDSNPNITFPSNKLNIETTIGSFDEVVRKIEKRNYDMAHVVKSDKQCGECDMKYHCNPRQYSNN